MSNTPQPREYTPEQREMLLRVLILIVRASEEVQRNLCLSESIRESCQRPKLALASDGTVERMEKMGLKVGAALPSVDAESARKMQTVVQLGVMSEAHLADLEELCLRFLIGRGRIQATHGGCE